MYRKFLSGVVLLSLGSSVWGQGLVYQNDALVLAPPAIPPTIDAPTFINQGRFIINFTNDFIFTFPPPAELLPYEMQNVLNFTNRFGSFMSCNLGFRFQYFNPTIGQRRPMASFFNEGIINSGTVDTSNFVTTADIRFIGTTNVFILGLEGNRFVLDATNIVIPGAINMGFDGFLRLNGDSVDLSRSTFSMEAVGASTFNFNFFFNGGIFDNQWGLSTNVISPAGFFEGNPPSTPIYSATDRNYALVIEQLVLQNSLSFLSDQTDAAGSNRFVRAVFLSNTNAAFAANVYFPTAFNLNPFTPGIIVEFTNVLGTATNNLYVLDYFGTLTNFTLVPNGFAGSRATFIPFNYSIFQSAPFFFIPGLSGAQPIPFGTFNSTPTTNEYSSYQALFQPISYVITDVFGQDVTNAPGRMEIRAEKYLNLANARISSLNFLGLRSPNNFAGSAGAAISAPYVDIDLRTTNGVFAVTNLLEPTLGRPEGTLNLWSARWTNVTGTLTNQYHVLFVDAHFSDRSPSRVQDLVLKTTGGQDLLIISDVLNVTRSFKLDARSVIITTNEPGAAAPTGALNLLNANIVWSSASPRLQYLTNNGTIQALNTMFLGGSRTSPYYTSNFNEPYFSFVNTGGVTNFASLIWATNFLNTGVFSASGGSISLQKARGAVLTNGAFLAASPGGAIGIESASLLVSNHTLQAGSSLSLAITNFLDDGSYYALVDQVTNKNIWNAGNGFNLLVAPAYGSLLGTTVTNTAGPFQQSLNQWAGANYGPTPDAYTSQKTNNAALGRLILDGATNSVFTFAPLGANKALYVDSLELENFTATNRDASGNFLGIQVAPGMTVYFAQAVANGVSIAEKLNGKNGGTLRWISNYHCGFFSSTNLVLPGGATNRVNQALAQSQTIDSDGDGTVNSDDLDPIPGPLPNCNVVLSPPVPGAVIPNFSATPTSGLAPLIVQFSNLSTGASSYLWDFGDGSTSTVTNPVKTYTLAGNYNVTLTAAGPGGTNSLAMPSFIVTTNLPGAQVDGGSGPRLPSPPASLAGTNILADGFLRGQGVYNGLFYETNGVAPNSSGFFTARTTARGTYSARLTMNGRTYPLSGQFNAKSGLSAGAVQRAAGGLTADLRLDMAGGGHINGRISGSGFTAELFADRATRTASKASYTMVIPSTIAASNSASGPAGDSFAAVKVNAKGSVVAAGTLADGSKFSLKSAVSEQGIWPVYSAPYRGGGGLLISWLQVGEKTSSDLGGQMIWLRPPGSLSPIYARGFTNDAQVLGSGYAKPFAGAPALDLSPGQLLLLGSGLNQTNNITLGANNKAAAPANRLSFAITSSSGLFKGTMLDPQSGQIINFQGAVLQNTNAGRGFFLKGSQSGGVRLESVP